MSIKAVLSHWPSVADLAADMGVPVATAKQWRSRESIPARHWERLIQAAERRGYPVTAETLVTASRKAA